MIGATPGLLFPPQHPYNTQLTTTKDNFYDGDSEYPAGTFCWIDLATDPGAAKSFYGELLGWDYLEVPTDVGTTYNLATIEARQVAAICPLPSARGTGGEATLLAQLCLRRQCREAATKAVDLGGTLLMEPFDVMTAGRMSVIQDPTGALFSVWGRRITLAPRW